MSMAGEPYPCEAPAVSKREIIQPDGLATPAAPYSPVVVSGDLVYTAGCLESAGCGFGDVLKVSCFLADLADFPGFNEAYREYFEEPYPVRTTVGVTLPPGLLVEIDVVARRP